jgi:hypothetical protein
LAEACAHARGELADLLAAYCAFELIHRRLRFDFITYTAVLEGYGNNEEFIFSIVDVGEVKLREARPLGY